MKNLTKKLSYAIYIVLAVVLLSSCDKFTAPTQTTVFIVEEVDYEESGLASYKIEPLNKGNLNCNTFWICDSIGAFNINQKVVISTYNR